MRTQRWITMVAMLGLGVTTASAAPARDRADPILARHAIALADVGVAVAAAPTATARPSSADPPRGSADSGTHDDAAARPSGPGQGGGTGPLPPDDDPRAPSGYNSGSYGPHDHDASGGSGLGTGDRHFVPQHEKAAD